MIARGTIDEHQEFHGARRNWSALHLRRSAIRTTDAARAGPQLGQASHRGPPPEGTAGAGSDLHRATQVGPHNSMKSGRLRRLRLSQDRGMIPPPLQTTPPAAHPRARTFSTLPPAKGAP